MSSRKSVRTSPKRSDGLNSKRAAHIQADTNADANMTDAVDPRRQKKRELDRKCQRMARERTKARIAYLEDLVEDFRQQDASGRVASLMRQLQDTAKERDDLTKTLKVIESSIRTHRVVANGDTHMKHEDLRDGTIPAIESMASRSAGPWKARSAFDSGVLNDETLGSSPEEEVSVEVEPEGVPDFSTAGPIDEHVDNLAFKNEYTPYLGEDQDVIYPPPKKPCECCRAKSAPSYGAPINMWRFANETLAKRETYSDEVLELEDAIGDDVPVRALTEGWDAVEARLGGGLPPMWQTLRNIDEVIFGHCASTERLAIMRVMHLLLRYHAQPTPARKQALPAWYLKRPSQTLAHSYAIDFFVWPGVRERFVFHQHRYCSNLFWQLFCRSFHLLWPFEFRDTYTYNTVTGEYKISASFDDRISDINAWAMARDIFKQWPEFYSDFPTWEHIPMSIGGVGIAASKQARAGLDKTLVSSPSGYVSSVTVATSSNAPTAAQQRARADRMHLVDHRGPADEVDDATEEAQRSHSASTAPNESPLNNALSFQGVGDWWGSPYQFGPGQYEPAVRAAGFAMPMDSAPQATLNTMSQMYDLPI